MRFYFLLLLFFIFNDVFSQSWYKKREINWDLKNIVTDQQLSTRDLTCFSFAWYKDYDSKLPYFSDIIEWHTNDHEVTTKLFSAVYDELPDEYKDDKIFSILSDHINIDHHISIENKKYYLVYSLLPFRKNPVTGKVERLKEFTLEINQIPVKKFTVNSKKQKNVSQSVLSTGEWYKIKISSSGIHKLTYEQLKTLGLTDPATVRIFGYGGHVLPEDIREGCKDDLIPVQIYMNKGSDNVFNQGDFILFYATGTDKWYYDDDLLMFRCEKNPYSDNSYYFLTCNKGPVDIPVDHPVPEGEITFNANTYDYFVHHELYLRNFIKSGRKWYGEEFDLITQHSIEIKIPALVVSEPLTTLTHVLSRSPDSSTFVLEVNGNDIETFRIRPVILSDYNGTYAFDQQKKTSFLSSSGNINLNLRYIKPEPTAKGWLDFITLNAKAELTLLTDQLIFRNNSVVVDGAITRFTISNTGENIIVWDVSDPNNILNVPYSIHQGSIFFLSETSELKEFAVFRKTGNFPSPEFIGDGLGRVENQNLHGTDIPDLVIITHENFMEQANDFACYRAEKSNIRVLITTPEKIFNEFSSGTPDVTALRNFLSMLYERSSSDSSLKNLLLFGNGSYDNKGVTPNPGNFIPTYQSENSVAPISSYISDDYFALLDPGEQMITGLLDIGVGRLPVSTVDQAKAVINKIKEYEDPSNMGKWRNVICFIGDDEDFNIHIHQADQLANYVHSNYPSFNINKIYLDAYRQFVSPIGQRYPEVNRAINDQMTSGALVVNYTGHGGVDALAHEKVVTMSDVNSWKNKGKYPLILTATCDFSRFDDFERITTGEGALLNPAGGGIALLTTTRLVYTVPNHALNERFYEIAFEKNEDMENYCLGDIMKYTKNKTGTGINKRNFTLLGDPSMKLAYPGLKIITDSINDKPVYEPLDTLKAFSHITITGHVEDYSGNIVNDMNGVVYPIVYDKPSQFKTLANDGGSTVTFSLQDNILYNGKASLNNGYFQFRFIVPKDINYNLDYGKLSYYAHDETKDASGSFSEILIGGTTTNYSEDFIGPEVKVYMNNEHFKPGDITSPDPVLFIKVYDEHGINTAGNSVGHDITATLDDQSSEIFVLNEYFQADIDSYQGGIIKYPFFNLSEGMHRISVTVWDIFNNSGEGNTEFIVVDSKDFFLNEIINFPNPFNENTWFSFGHNRPEDVLEITIEIFNTSGEIVRTLKSVETGSGFRSVPVLWDGKDGTGNKVSQGIYIYRIKVTDLSGEIAEKSGKLMIIR